MPIRRRRKPKRKPRRKRTTMTRYRKPLRLGGIDPSKLVRLKYVEHVSLGPGAGTYATYKWRANDIYDPNLTGGGHQPSGHDFWSNVYDNFTVVGSKCKAYPFWTQNSANLVPGVMVLALSHDGNTISTAHAAGGVNNVLEQPRLSRTIRNIGVTNNYVSEIPLIKHFSAKKFFGTKSIVGVGKYSGQMGTSSPSEGAYYELSIMSVDDANDPGTYNVRVEIEYIVLLSEPKETDAS